jgi:hypothetical protein
VQEITTHTQKSDALRFEVLTAEQFFDQAVDLLIDHREELATDKALMVLKPDFETYYNLDELGALLVIGAYRGDRLVGYSVNLISKNLHYADLVQCQNDVLFLDKSERKGSAGLRLIRKTQELARFEGAKIMLWHAKPETNLDQLMPRMGASVQDVIWKVNL